MSIFGVKLPDVGEGIVEAELVSWLVRVGDHVMAEAPLAEVLTDKATVEISSPITGTITFLHGEPGEMLAVGFEFVGIETGVDAPDAPVAAAPPPPLAEVASPAIAQREPTTQSTAEIDPRPRAIAAPAVRQRARSLGIDLRDIVGTGPNGQVTHADLDRRGDGIPGTSALRATSDAVRLEPIRGLRRRIGERLSQSWAEIPHITYVDEVDATEVEKLRAALNERGGVSGTRLTLLPFLIRALTIACREQPRLNAHYDAESQSLSIFDAAHVGIATQTPDGLLVPVLRHAEGRELWELAAEIARLATVAREGRATREELSGSTITITSLGSLGGLMTTPIINRPEVAIVGVNKMQTRPVWSNGAAVPRQMFNLSSSFDHRIVDGWDAATFVQRLKALLESPALMFVDRPDW